MKVMLLAGGESNEHAVSLESGESVYLALKRLGHYVLAVDPSTGKSLLNSDGSYIEYKRGESGKPILPGKSKKFSLGQVIGSPAFQDIDVVFIALHGGLGENGMVQSLLEFAKRNYTGSNMTSSAIAMDKAISKRICQAENIKTADFAIYRLNQTKLDDRLLAEISQRFHFPFIVKPNDGGSTIGLTKVEEEYQIREALERALLESNNVLVEQYIRGREITAAVLDGKPLPLVEIKPKSGMYDFEAKYNKGMSEYVSPAPLDESLTQKMMTSAKKIYDAIGCSGLARVDYILDENLDFYFLELNTLPGMTELSLAPMAAQAAGISFDELIEKIINSALNRS